MAKTVKIEVEVPSLEPEEVEHAVVQEVVRRTLSWVSVDEGGAAYEVPSTLSQKLMEAVAGEIRGQARDAAGGMVEKILAGEVPTVDRYGYTTGEPKSVAEIVRQEVTKALQHRNGQRGLNVLEAMVREAVAQAMKEHVEALTAAVAGPIREAVLAQVDAATKKAVTGR